MRNAEKLTVSDMRLPHTAASSALRGARRLISPRWDPEGGTGVTGGGQSDKNEINKKMRVELERVSRVC